MADIAGTITAINQAGQFEDYSNLIVPFGYKKEILLPRLPVGEPAHYHTIEWLEDQLRPDTIATAGGALANSTTATTFSPDSAADMSRYRKGDLFMVGSEICRVTTIGTSTVTVTRGFGDSSVAAHSSTATVLLLGRAIIDGATALTATATLKVKKSNYLLAQETTLAVGDQENVYAQPGGPELMYQKKKQGFIEHLKEIDKHILYGTKSAESASSPGSFGGIMEFLTTTHTFTGAADTTTQTLTYEAFQSCLATIHEAGGSPNLCVANATGIKTFSKWVSADWRSDMSGGGINVGRKVTGISTGFGDLPVLHNKHLTHLYHGRAKAKGVILILDTTKLKIRWLRDIGKTKYVQLPFAGHAQKGMFTSVLSMERRNALAHGVINRFNNGG